MNIYWIFIGIIAFCIYIFFGLHITEGLESSSQIILGWVIYTLLWITFLNIFTLGYFWSIVRNKTGPYGLRGPEGEEGDVGIQGKCNINMAEAYCIKSLNDYINNLYKEKTGRDILNQDTQTFPCVYLNEKINKIAGSRQYNVIVTNLSNEDKPIDSLVNYLKSIWKQWFDLIFNATNNNNLWFEDEFGDENYSWIGNNPFIEIKKYDIYYWGITRAFRPLKAEICRSTLSHADSKLPKPQLSREKEEQVVRLKIMQTNNYTKMGDTTNNDENEDGSWWRPQTQMLDGDKYYPIGDVMYIGANNPGKNGHTITGPFKYDTTSNGPDKKTVIISGDVVSPIGYRFSANPHTKSRSPSILTPICPDGYTSLGDIAAPGGSPGDSYKCLPTECLEEISPGPIKRDNPYDPNQWNRYNRWFNWRRARYSFTYYSSINVLDRYNNEPTFSNGYNLMRGSEAHGSQGNPYYKIKKTCLEKKPKKDFPRLPIYPPPSTKELEENNADLGIGWYGHPYKLDPKYSIFSFLNILPEGMIVNKGTGQRFYIVHVEGEDINLFNILTHNYNTNKYDGSLQINIQNIDDPNDKNIPNNKNYEENSNLNSSEVDPKDTYITPVNLNPPPKRIIITSLEKINPSQQWRIIINDNKKFFKLKNVYNNTYLLASQEPREGIIAFTTIDIDNNNYLKDPAFNNIDKVELNLRTDFSFISTFGTQLDIVDKNDTNRSSH
jgi:hypothetical protein